MTSVNILNRGRTSWKYRSSNVSCVTCGETPLCLNMKLWIPAERISQNICHMVKMKSEYKLV